MITIIKRFRDVMEAHGFKFNAKASDIDKEFGREHYFQENGQDLFFQKENPALPGTLEAIDRPIYDAGDVVSATTTSLDYFQTPVGQAGKTLILTNMRQAGILPSPEKFTINRLGALINTTSVADLYTLTHRLVLTFSVNSKIYTQAPLFFYPAGFGVYGFSTNNNTGPITLGVPGENGVRSMLYPIPLEPLDPFIGNLTMYGGAADAIGSVTLTATTRIWIVLQGPYSRAI